MDLIQRSNASRYAADLEDFVVPDDDQEEDASRGGPRTAAPICYRRLVDMKQHLSDDHGVDPRDVKVKDGQFWQRFKIRETDGLLQKYTAKLGAQVGLERQGSAGTKNVLNTSASQGSLAKYWNSGVGSGVGSGIGMGDLRNGELYNWVHHDSETAHQEELEEAERVEAEASGGAGLSQLSQSQAARPEPPEKTATMIWRRYAPAADRAAEESAEGVGDDDTPDLVVRASAAAWSELTANFGGYDSGDENFICDDEEESDADSSEEEEEEEAPPVAAVAAAARGRGKKGQGRAAATPVSPSPKKQTKKKEKRASLTAQEMFLRQQAADEVERERVSFGQNGERLSLHDVLPHLSQGSREETRDADLSEDDWSGDDVDDNRAHGRYTTGGSDEDGFIQEDEALANESEVSDDALDRAEAAMTEQRKMRKSSAAAAGPRGGRRSSAAASASAAGDSKGGGGRMRRSRRPSSKDQRKAKATALVQDLQLQAGGKKRRLSDRRSNSSAAAAAEESDDDDDLGLMDEDEIWPDEIESSAAEEEWPRGSRRRAETKRQDNPRNHGWVAAGASRPRAEKDSKWKQAALAFIQEDEKGAELSDDVSEDEEEREKRRQQRRRRKRAAVPEVDEDEQSAEDIANIHKTRRM